MKIDKNTVIKCSNLNEVKDCLDKLNEFGFNTDKYFPDDSIFIFYADNVFTGQPRVMLRKQDNIITYEYFLELYKKQIKENKQPDLVVDKNGRVLKINNWNSDKKMFFYDTTYNEISGTISISKFNKEKIQEKLKNSDYYITYEACEKALKRKNIENKLRLLAFELNGNRDIDWNDNKEKYCIYYNVFCQSIGVDNITKMKDMNIYCYSEDFKDKAIKLIGEEDLKDYLN